MRMSNVNYLQVTFAIICCFQVYCVVGTYVKLTHDGPGVQGGSITFKAEVHQSDDLFPITSYTYVWRDDGMGDHKYETPETKNKTSVWKVDYPADMYPPGEYSVQVTLIGWRIGFWPYRTSAHRTFEITNLLNGNMTIVQSNHTVANEFVSTDNETEITIDLRKGDYDYIKNNATELSTYWFIDCKYYGQTNDFNFSYNFTKADTESTIEALIVASYEPLPTPPPTTTTTTTEIPTTTTPASKNVTTQNPTVSTTTMKAIEIKLIDSKKVDKSSAGLMKNLTDKIVISDGNISLPYVCINSSIISPDPKKTYGYFNRKVTVNEPIKSISINGSTWIQPWDMLSLSVNCHGSGPFVKCIEYHSGHYNVTGNETCDDSYGMLLTTCDFSITRYFFEPNVYTVLMILRNNISTQVYPITVNIYEVTPKPQLSVIVVPVSCSLAAVVLIVFGIAYYLQSRSRYTVEVANFDFGQNNPDMEYKTFTERLKDSFNSSGYKTLGSPKASDHR